MTHIFISYRRDDTTEYAERFYEDLVKYFTVFMDRETIQGGTNWQERINQELKKCDVLLVLIGPDWLTCAQNGKRKLAHKDDWVRREIVKALKRKIPVIPVLFDHATFPDQREFPDSPGLRRFCKQQCSKNKFSKEDPLQNKWDAKVHQLVMEIKDCACGETGKNTDRSIEQIALNRLKLILTKQRRDDGIVIKERIEQYSRQLAKLELYKKLHDLFHDIECDILCTIQEQGPGCPLNLLKFQFSKKSDGILECIQKDPKAFDANLQADVKDQLDEINTTFRIAAETKDKKDRVSLIAALTRLTGVIPARLNERIVSAADNLKSNEVTEQIEKLHSEATSDLMETKPSIPVFDEFKKQQNELTRRVKEHACLQRLNSELRERCIGKPDVSKEAWQRILQRDWCQILDLPISSEMDNVLCLLKEIANDMEQVNEKNKKNNNSPIIQYFTTFVKFFRDVDKKLKEFCPELNNSSEKLKQTLLVSEE